jgi:hypothetical protein
MLHARSVLPYETSTRESSCVLNSKLFCPVGIQCPTSTPYIDNLLKKNVFTDEQGQYCNCWSNDHVEKELLPMLEKSMRA